MRNRCRRVGSPGWRSRSTKTPQVPSSFRWQWRPLAPCRWAMPRAGRLSPALLRIAADATKPDDLRLSALAAVPGGLSKPDESLFAFLLGKLARTETVASRTTAADVLARAKLSPEQLGRLAETLRSAGPVEVDRLLAAFEQSNDESLGLKAPDSAFRLARPFQPAGRRGQEPPGEIPRRGTERGRSARWPKSTSMPPSKKPSSSSSCPP